ncbi:hypothetical protein HDE_05621 [Halotydeus destructor]|nr:hypothetical protein HDE_05621 [Halotydeus destructor]
MSNMATRNIRDQRCDRKEILDSPRVTRDKSRPTGSQGNPAKPRDKEYPDNPFKPWKQLYKNIAYSMDQDRLARDEASDEEEEAQCPKTPVDLSAPIGTSKNPASPTDAEYPSNAYSAFPH